MSENRLGDTKKKFTEIMIPNCNVLVTLFTLCFHKCHLFVIYITLYHIKHLLLLTKKDKKPHGYTFYENSSEEGKKSW